MAMTKKPRNFVVKTSFGVAIHSEDKSVLKNRVYSKVSALEKGDHIFWADGNNTLCDIYEVDAILADNNQEYDQARKMLLVDIAGGGRTVPRLGYELLRAAEKKGFFSENKETLHELLLNDGIPSFQINDITDYIHDSYVSALKNEEHTQLNDQGTPVLYSLDQIGGMKRVKTKSTIKSWVIPSKLWRAGLLLSKTLYISIPRDLDDLLVLAMALNHEPLMDMYDDGAPRDDAITLLGARSFYFKRNYELISDVINAEPEPRWGLSYGQVLEV